jgi:hypothetical protein
MSALTSRDLPDRECPAVQERLRALHPQAHNAEERIGALPAPPIAVPKVSVDPADDAVVGRLRRWADNGASGGPSGLLGAFLVPLLDDVHCRQGLCQILEDIINGEVDVAASSTLLACRLMPLAKEAGGVRPIAIGDVLVRLAGRLAIDNIRLAMGRYFGNVQLACGARGGSQVAMQVIQAVLYSEYGAGDMKAAGISFDFTNAFNEVSRRLILERLYRLPQFQSVWKLAHWMLTSPAVLLTVKNGQVVLQLDSEVGVRQGDALGTFLFCLGIHDEYLEAVAAAPANSVTGVGLSDNFTLVGSAVHVVRAARTFVELVAARHDLRLNAVQEKVLWMHEDAAPDALSGYARDRGAELVTADGVVRLLGVRIGARADRVREEEIAAMVKDLKELDILLDPALPVQAAALLTRNCVGPKATYLMRSAYPSRVAAAVLLISDMADRLLFQRVLRVDAERLPGALREQLVVQSRLPARKGFPGLASAHPAQHLDAAFIAGLAQAAPLLDLPSVKRFAVDNARLQEEVQRAMRSETVQAATERTRAKLPPEEAAGGVSLDAFVAFYKAHAEHRASGLQLCMTHETHRRARDTLDAMFGDQPADLALRRAVSEAGCSRWINTLPDSNFTTLTDEEYTFQARLTLGYLIGLTPNVDPLENEAKCLCPAHVRAIDAPFHAPSCKAILRTLKLDQHDASVSVHCTFNRRAGLASQPHAFGWDQVRWTKRMPDLTVYRGEGGVMLLDMTTWNPLAACAPRALRPLEHCMTTERTLATAERTKRVKYADMEVPGVQIVPLAYTIFGAAGPAARDVMSFKHVRAADYVGVLGTVEGLTKLSEQYQNAVTCTIVKSNVRLWKRMFLPLRDLRNQALQRELVERVRRREMAEYEVAGLVPEGPAALFVNAGRRVRGAAGHHDVVEEEEVAAVVIGGVLEQEAAEAEVGRGAESEGEEDGSLRGR